jgi:hypothetical protein
MTPLSDPFEFFHLAMTTTNELQQIAEQTRPFRRKAILTAVDTIYGPLDTDNEKFQPLKQ